MHALACTLSTRLLLALLQPPDPTTDPTWALYMRGQARFETTDYATAIALWSRALASVPAGAEHAGLRARLHLDLANAHVMAYRVQGVRSHLDRAGDHLVDALAATDGWDRETRRPMEDLLTFVRALKTAHTHREIAAAAEAEREQALAGIRQVRPPQRTGTAMAVFAAVSFAAAGTGAVVYSSFIRPVRGSDHTFLEAAGVENGLPFFFFASSLGQGLTIGATALRARRQAWTDLQNGRPAPRALGKRFEYLGAGLISGSFALALPLYFGGVTLVDAGRPGGVAMVETGLLGGTVLLAAGAILTTRARAYRRWSAEYRRNFQISGLRLLPTLTREGGALLLAGRF